MSTPIRSPRTRPVDREHDPDAPTRRLRRRTARHRTDRPVLAVGGHPAHGAGVVGHRPPEGVRPARPARRRQVGRERIGAPPRHRRPDVRIRVDARVRRRRRSPDDPLADHRPRGNPDGARARRGASTGIHRRPRHRSPTVGTPDDFEEAVDVVATLAVHATRSGLDVVVRTTDRNHAGRPTPLVADSMSSICSRRSNDRPTTTSCIRRAVHRRLRPHLRGVRHRAQGTVERFITSERLSMVRIGEGASRRPASCSPRTRARVRESLAEHAVNVERSSRWD